MHKLAILTIVIFGIILTVSSHAATKCVALNSSSTCTGTPSPAKVDWSATCDNIPVTGVGVCSTTSGTTGQTADSIATENAPDANIYCWCKMTSPAVSRFVYARIGMSAEHCSGTCAGICVSYAVNFAPFRVGLFSDLQ